jgi:transcriptional regulator with XRE-family HTH domain
LKAELVRRGITQTELARRMNVNRSYLSQILNGIEPMKPHYARLISVYAKIPLASILPNGQEAAS